MTTKLEKWHIFDEKTAPVQILDERSLFVADAKPKHARLIAAAPDQLNALLAAPEMPEKFETAGEIMEFTARYAEWFRSQRTRAIRAAVGAQEEKQ